MNHLRNSRCTQFWDIHVEHSTNLTQCTDRLICNREHLLAGGSLLEGIRFKSTQELHAGIKQAAQGQLLCAILACCHHWLQQPGMNGQAGLHSTSAVPGC